MDKTRYFDWAATALADEDILTEALLKSLETGANPSSVHTPGTAARVAFEAARERCAKALGVKPAQLVFTSGGTESDQIPLVNLLRRPAPGTILISAIEHPAVREMADSLKATGWKVNTVRPDKSGRITPEAVVEKLTDDTMLVAVMAVNNETGAIQPIYAVADAITAATKGRRRPKFHVDAVQAVGKIPVNLNYPGIDSAAMSAHKICGPRGVGLLYLRERIEPFLRGGGQENGLRSGTENLFGALATAACLERYAIATSGAGANGTGIAGAGTSSAGSANTDGLSRMLAVTELGAGFISAMREVPGAALIPQDRTPLDDRFSNAVVQVSFRNIPGNVMVRALSEKGFYISTGSACSARKASRPVLEAMGITGELSQNAVRFSFSSHSTQEGTAALVEAVTETVRTFNGQGHSGA